MTPPLGFSTPPQIPNITTSERLPVTTSVFAVTTPENTPFAYHASTSTNPNLTISPAFVEANYEILESLLRERQRQIRNEDLRTELEYFSEDYDEEREMEPRPEPREEATPTLRLRSDSPHNMLLGRTTMQRMGIVVSTIHGAIKFHTEKGIGIALSTDEASEGMKRDKRIPATSKERLPDHFKKELQNLLKSNADVFACTHADMTGILRTIMIEGKLFNTKHKLVLQGAKLNYPTLEKLVLALVHAARRLQRYFQAHTITVLTNTSIKQILTGLEKTRRVAKWAIELGEHDIVFLRREEKETPTNFLVETPFKDNVRKEKPKEVPNSSNKWRHYTDRASNSDGSGAGLMLIDPEGKEYIYALRFEFETTNNEAEYEALLADLRIAQEMEIAKVAIFLDSQLLVNQIKGTFIAKQASIKDYLQKIKISLRGFEVYTVEYVRRNQNKKADALSKLA
uniref:Reverse transcriptase domain-containing protein n=1 Tax=Tanacetum cinerariifolium TaxID=118510 RepID=A0A6L2LIL9_TANCI|nr:reverse transcriptase domain-containing protein [Tanacetum cinerariifolium]